MQIYGSVHKQRRYKVIGLGGNPFFVHKCHLLKKTTSGKNLLTTLVTDYVQKRRGQALLLSFEHNLLSKLLTDFYHNTDQPLSSHQYESTKKSPILENKLFANLSKNIINASYFEKKPHKFINCRLNKKNCGINLLGKKLHFFGFATVGSKSEVMLVLKCSILIKKFQLQL